MTQEELQALFNSENSVVIENKDTQEASQEELARMFESAKTPAPSEEEEAISKDGIEDNQPISSEKQTLIEDEYTLKKNRILKAKEEYPDNVDIYDLALNKLEQNKLDKIEQEKLNIIKKQKEAETLASARKDTALNRTTAATEMAWIGGTRPILGLSRIIEGATDYLGWTDDETTFFKDKIEKREAELNQYMKDKGLNPETMNVDDLMQFVVEWSPVGLANKAIKTVSLGKKALDNYLKSTAVLEGTTIGASTAGSVNEEGKAMSKGDITSSAIGGTFLVYGGAKAFKVLERLVGDISYEAQIMLRKADKTPEEVADILKDVPKSEQAKTLAEAFGGEFSGNYKQAISDSDDVRRKVTKDINERAKEFEEAVGMNDFENLKSSAERMYKSLELQMKRSNIEADVSDLTEGFTRLKNLGGAEETLLGQIEGLGNEIAEKPFMNITRMLEIRKNLNDIGKKSKGKNSTVFGIADDLKTRLDIKLKKNLPDDLHDMFDKTMSNYGIYKEQETINNIINKNKLDIGYGGEAEKVSYNYGNILKSLKDEGLYTKEAEASIGMIEQMNRKFGNDFDFFELAKTKGDSTKGGFLGLWGAIVNSVKVPLAKFTPTEFAENIYIQEAITKAIKESDSGAEFAKNIAVNKNLADDIKGDILQSLGNIRTRNASQRNMLKLVKQQQRKLPAPSDFYASQKGGNVGQGINDMDNIRASRELQRRGESSRRGTPTIEVEVIEESTKALPNKDVKTAGKDIIDAEVISYGNKPKKLTEKQAKDWNSKTKEIDSINKKIESMNRAKKSISKGNLSSAKKKAKIQKYDDDINQLKSKAVTIEKKLPKI